MIRLNKDEYSEEFKCEFFSDVFNSDKRKKKGCRYSSVVCSFDIETSDVEINGCEGNVVYLWSFSWVDITKCFGKTHEEIMESIKTVSGRDMKQFDSIYCDIKNVIDATDSSVIIYVHNLDYELDRILIQCENHKEFFCPEKSLFIGSHQPLFVKFGSSQYAEYRDSAKLLNATLANAAEEYGFKKLGYDYSFGRFSESELEENDWEYNINDAKITIGIIIKMCEYEKYYHPRDIPLTSTSRTRYANTHDEEINKVIGTYVRKEGNTKTKEETVYDRYKKTAMKERLFDESIDKAGEEFTGGFTHANRFFSFIVVEDVLSCDFISDYPGVMTSCMYPYVVKEYNGEDKMNVFIRCHRLNMFKLGNDIVNGILENYICPTKCWFSATVVFRYVKAKKFGSNGNSWEMPLISVSKALNKNSDKKDWSEDNGRVIEGEHVKLTINAIDMLSISIMYDYEIEDVEWLEVSERMAPLDDFKLNCIKKWYSDKCGWKIIKNKSKAKEPIVIEDFVNNQVRLCDLRMAEEMVKLYSDNKEEFDFRVSVEYGKAKNRLNGQYGIMVMAVKREDTTCLMEDGEYKYVNGGTSNTHQSEIYRHGVCITSYARLFLSVFTYIVAKRSGATPIYWDTDSVKLCIKGSSKEAVHEAVLYYNSFVTKVREDIPCEIGHMDDNDGYYDKFVTLGCKRYMTLEDGKVNVTVSGLPKRDSIRYYNELYKKFGEDFDTLVEHAFKPNTFVSDNATGKLIPMYFDGDRPYMKGEAVDYKGKKCNISEWSGYRLVKVGFALCDLTKPENMVYYKMCTECRNEVFFEPEDTIITKDNNGYSISYGRCFVPDVTLYKVQ